MQKNSLGQVILDQNDLFNLLYKKGDINFENVLVTKDAADHFNEIVSVNKDNFPKLKTVTLEIDKEKFDQQNQSTWFMPNEYVDDIEDYVISLCTSNDELIRVKLELELYKKHNMMKLLGFLRYLVNVMKENNIVWGVGRGSSVSSYILYLLGVHRVNSLKYNLEISEFLK